MGHTYTSLFYHIVFSTKARKPFLNEQIMPRLVKFTGGVIRQRGGALLAMGCRPEHVHILALLHAKRAVSESLRDIKAISSGWVRDHFTDCGGFAWQEGYGAFSVSKSNLPQVNRYIERQEAHHKKMTFEEELVALLEKHGIEYDPRHVFD